MDSYKTSISIIYHIAMFKEKNNLITSKPLKKYLIKFNINFGLKNKQNKNRYKFP